MRARASKYLNEFISLSILTLLSLALIAGQAQAIAPTPPDVASGHLGANYQLDEHVLAIDIDFSFRHKGE